ncbi:hypothetical protein AGABI2DRAFT_180791 [Agaricus bisporus var. bisporus H97]|uniref:hypothetical protein n=1 Tax=Agaricus bisporus var. bisporus (strain H97 / ATCC MYA-4626 / FGSC 10389) TaxID=936046 RepID=UPI00029F5210|nr:hypothetical protein AGABI2DRAFT_180791 [Agaricus bisporus var. bisporus H97]EKV42988.1 hypothetical protein AGABI2DRAFT_180791 [Agaricus bisporus var. bisporus H97]
MSESDSSGSYIDESFWRNSPSPEANDEMGEEGKEWYFEVVGEEVDADGDVRQVDWDGWKRADGTTQTWQRMNPNLTREWRVMQRRRREDVLKDSIDIDLGAFSGVDIHNDETRLRAQAYKDKLALRRRYSPKLEEQMAKLLAEKLGDGAELDNHSSPSSAVPTTPAGRGLRLSTIRQQQQKSPMPQRRGPSQGQDDANKSQTPTSSLRPSQSARTMSASSSRSNSRPSAPPAQINYPHSSQSKNSTATPIRDPQDRTARKRKVSESEVDQMGEQQRERSTIVTADKGKAPMNKILLRLECSLKWTKIARAAGAAPITIVNDVDDEEIPFLALGFCYLEKGYQYPPYIDPPKLDFQVGCDCKRCGDASQCDCQSVSELVDDDGQKIFAYTKTGLFSFNVPRHVEVVECNETCRCGPGCINRVSQRPRDVPLEIFKTRGKGWGVRAAVDIVRGKVLGMYSGKLLSRQVADKMTNSRDGEYIFDLDGQEDLKDGDGEELMADKYSIDSRTYGNWTHFVNHSCTPNMIIYLAVYVTLPGTNCPYLTFVAQEFIKAGTELTMDYDPAFADMMELDDVSSMGGMRECFTFGLDWIRREIDKPVEKCFGSEIRVINNCVCIAQMIWHLNEMLHAVAFKPHFDLHQTRDEAMIVCD